MLQKGQGVDSGEMGLTKQQLHLGCEYVSQWCLGSAQGELYLGRMIHYLCAFVLCFCFCSFLFLGSFASDCQPDGWPSGDTVLLIVCEST